MVDQVRDVVDQEKSSGDRFWNMVVVYGVPVDLFKNVVDAFILLVAQQKSSVGHVRNPVGQVSEPVVHIRKPVDEVRRSVA